MIPRPGAAAALLAVLAISGCSFSGSLSDRAPSHTPAVTPGSTGPTGSTSPAPSVLVGTEEIVFPVGKTTTVVQGRAEQGTQQRYFFQATAGQTATLSLSSTGDSVVFALTGPQGQPLPAAGESRRGRFPLSQSGAYVVTLSSPTAGVPYALTLDIPPA